MKEEDQHTKIPSAHRFLHLPLYQNTLSHFMPYNQHVDLDVTKRTHLQSTNPSLDRIQKTSPDN